MKKSFLKRGNSQMKRSPLKGRKALPFMSSKAKERSVKRRELVGRTLACKPYCEACSAFLTYDGKSGRINRSVDLHEKVMRSQGGDILDTSIIMAVCRPCHMRIGDNSKVAHLLGMHLYGYQYKEEYIEEARKVLESWGDGVPIRPSYLED